MKKKTIIIIIIAIICIWGILSVILYQCDFAYTYNNWKVIKKCILNDERINWEWTIDFYRNWQAWQKLFVKDWELDGQQFFYYENGQIKSKQNYKDWKEDWERKYYDKEWNLTKVETYENWELITPEQF